MLGADDLGDPVAEVLRERGRGTARRDGDRDRLVAVDGGQDERAELRHVHDVAEERAGLRVAEDPAVDGGGARRGDDEEDAIEILGPVAPADDGDAELRKLRRDLGSNNRDGGTRREEAGTFSSATVPPPTTSTRRPVRSRQAM